MTNRFSPRWQVPAISTLALINAVAVLAIALASVPSKRDIQYPESAIVAGVLRTRDGVPLYADYRVEPFAIVAYTPLYYEIAGTLSRWGRSVSDVFLISRSLTLACALLVAFSIFAASKQVASSGASLTASFLFLGSGLLVPWGYMARVDMLALFFSAAALCLIVRFPRKSVAWAALLLVCAFFSKQNTVALVPAAALYLAWSDSRRAALKFSWLWAGGIVLGGALCFAFFGSSFKLNVVDAVAVPFRVRSIAEIASRALPSIAASLILALGIVSELRAARARSDSVREREMERRRGALLLFGLYLSIALIGAIVSSARAGSDVNYFLEPLFAACLCAAPSLDLLSRRRMVGLVQTAIVLAALLFDGGIKLGKYRHSEFLSPENREVVDLAKRTPGEILAQDSNVLLQAGKRASVTDSYHLAHLEKSGRWSSAPLLEKIERREFSLVILSFEIGSADRPDWSRYQGSEIWSESIQQAVLKNYRRSEVLGAWHVYRPLP